MGYGPAAAARLRAAVLEAKAGEPLAEVTVVVASNHVGVAARRLLGSAHLGAGGSPGSGIAAVTFLTLYRLAELLGAVRLAERGRRPVSTPVIAAAVRAALRDDPGVFRQVAEHAATEAALVAGYQDLRPLPEEPLERLAARSRRAADVVRLHRDVRRRLSGAFSDEEDLVAAASEALDAGDARVPELVVVHLPRRFTLHGAGLLRAVARRTDVLVLAGSTGTARADGDVARTLGLLVDTPPAPSGPRDEGPGLARVAVTRERVRIVTVSDADEEVRLAVRAIVEAARSGTPLERIAVLYGSADPYGRLVREHLAAAGIPANGAAEVPLAARVAGRTLLGLLALPATGFGREDVFAWLAGAPVRHAGRPVPVAAWERLSREAGVVAGRGDWDRRLATMVAERREEARSAGSDPDAPTWRAGRLLRDAALATGLRSFVLATVDDAATSASRRRRWSEHAAWARRRLRDLLGGAEEREPWPAEEQAGAEHTERALDRLAALDSVEGPVELDVFHRALQLELAADAGRIGRIGQGVTVGGLAMGVGLDLDLVVLLGMAEGSLPSPVREDPLLPDHEREAAGGLLALRAEGVERQHHDLLATLAGAARHVLCVPRGDLRQSADRVPSRWALDVAGSLEGRRLSSAELLAGAWPWLEHVSSFEHGLRLATFPATAQEHRLRSLLAGNVGARDGAGGGSRLEGGMLPVDDQVLSAGVATAIGRRSRRFTRFDGNLAGLQLPSPAEGVTSATRLEGWARCPFAYFARELLRVEPVENPEDRLRISPLVRGTLVHAVLERFIAEVLRRRPEEQPGPDDPWTEADRRRLLEIAEEECGLVEAHGQVGRPLFWRRDRRRLLADLERFLVADSTMRALRRTRPVAAELAFGLPGSSLPYAALPLPDGRAVRFRGKADRLDVGADGSLEVLDYKTGSASPYAGLGAGDPDAGGRHLQLAVYALAARLHAGRPGAPVRSEYWFTSARGEFRRIGYPVTATLLEQVGQTVGQMVEGIEAGVFPPSPDAANGIVTCPYCDPDGLGVADLRRQLERKRGEAALAPFLALTEGPSDAGAEGTDTAEDADDSGGGATGADRG